MGRKKQVKPKTTAAVRKAGARKRAGLEQPEPKRKYLVLEGDWSAMDAAGINSSDPIDSADLLDVKMYEAASVTDIYKEQLIQATDGGHHPVEEGVLPDLWVAQVVDKLRLLDDIKDGKNDGSPLSLASAWNDLKEEKNDRVLCPAGLPDDLKESKNDSGSFSLPADTVVRLAERHHKGKLKTVLDWLSVLPAESIETWWKWRFTFEEGESAQEDVPEKHRSARRVVELETIKVQKL